MNARNAITSGDILALLSVDGVEIAEIPDAIAEVLKYLSPHYACVVRPPINVVMKERCVSASSSFIDTTGSSLTAVLDLTYPTLSLEECSRLRNLFHETADVTFEIEQSH